MMRNAAGLTQTTAIQSTGAVLPPSLYGDGPAHGWCYYFEKADLARQQGDWEKVVKLGEQAFSTGDYPNDPLERFVFIEGYAHIGDWDKAIQYSKVSYKVSKEYVGPLLCQLWKRIEAETAQSPERSDVLFVAQSMFICNP